MKNIHILPTDKPSRLYLFEERLILGDLVTVVFKNSGAVNQNIYITSDEEIKEGDCYLDLIEMIKTMAFLVPVSNNRFKKIILTTDQDLIKDGVKAIDDEFLEWFIKNPSCEYIQTTELSLFNGDTGESGHYKYEIIIPKEESKQETLEQTAVEWLVQKLSKEWQLEARDLYLINQAKEMEKEQKHSEYMRGWYDGVDITKLNTEQ